MCLLFPYIFTPNDIFYLHGRPRHFVTLQLKVDYFLTSSPFVPSFSPFPRILSR